MKKYFYTFFALAFFSTAAFASNGVPTESEGDGVVVIESKKDQVSLSPNPAVTYTVLKSSSAIQRVSIFSILGNEVFDKAYNGEKQIELNVRNFRRGKYLVRVYFTDGSYAVTQLIKN